MLSSRPRRKSTARSILPLFLAAVIGCDDEAERGRSTGDAEVTARTDQTLDASADVALDTMDAADPSHAEAATTQYAALIDFANFHRYDAVNDPLKSHQPAEISCQLSATYLEYGVFEIDTTRCNYLLAETPALRTVPIGSEVHVNVLHYDLLASEPAQAHVALLFGDVVQWEKTISIPAPAKELDAVFRTTVPLTAQDPIRLHLHNHGGNTYLLVALEVRESP